MRKALIPLFILLIVGSLPTSVKAAPIQAEQPVVHAVLSWSNGCSYCNQVLTTTLPPIQDQYQSQLSILRNEMLSTGIAFTSFNPYYHLSPQTATVTNSTGIALAWGILVIMVIALILAILMILRAFQGKPLHEIKGWPDIAIPVLSIIGLGVSIYLTYVEVTHTRALCGPVGDCNAIQSSPYAKLFGVLPIGLMGAIGYIAILITWLWRRFRTDSVSKVAGPIMYGMALFGTLFSIYLTYLELFVIHAVCIWCLTSAVIITALMLLSLTSITQWLAISDEEE